MLRYKSSQEIGLRERQKSGNGNQEELNKWREFMSTRRRTRYRQAVGPPQTDLQIYCYPSQSPPNCLVGINKLILKFARRGNRPRIANRVSKKKNKVGGLAPPYFKTYHKRTVIEMGGIGKRQTTRPKEQRSGSETGPRAWSELMRSKGDSIQRTQPVQPMVLKHPPGHPHAENGSRPRPDTLHRN